MELLKELFEIIKAEELHESKKRKQGERKPPALGMVPITSFVAGNTVLTGNGAHMSESKKQSISVPAAKPRGKHVHDVLRSRKGGRMKSATDYDRNATKRETRKAMAESAEECCYFWYDVSWEVKNRSGEGPEAFDRHDHGVLKAATKEEAIAKVKKHHPDAMSLRVGKATKADYDKYMND